MTKKLFHTTARQFRLIVMLIGLIGLIIAAAAASQRLIEANSLPPNIQIKKMMIVTEDQSENLRIDYHVSPLGQQPDGSVYVAQYVLSYNGRPVSSAEPLPAGGVIKIPRTGASGVKKFPDPNGTVKIDIELTALPNARATRGRSVGRNSQSASVAELEKAGASKQPAQTKQQPVAQKEGPATQADPQPQQANQAETQEQAKAPSAVGHVAKAPTEFGSFSDLGDYASNIMKYALPLGIALAVIMTIYAGIIFMVSQGQPDRIKDAQEIIQGAILGLVILIMARFLVNFLILPGTETLDEAGNIIQSAEEQS